MLILGNFLNYKSSAPFWGCFLLRKSEAFNSTKFLDGLHLGDFFAKASGTDVMIFKIFLPNFLAKKLAFLTQNKANLYKMFIITVVFEKNANFFAENCQKSPKIVIITSTPGHTVSDLFCGEFS
jgi:hypothetical protein